MATELYVMLVGFAVLSFCVSTDSALFAPEPSVYEKLFVVVPLTRFELLLSLAIPTAWA